MVRVLYLFLLLAGLSALAIWLADNPGDLVMHWRGYEIKTSFVIGLGLLIGIAFIVLFGYRLASAIMSSPAGVASMLAERRRAKGFAALSRGMVAVAAGDAQEARRYAGQAHKLLDAPPLTLLLAAQAAQLEGDEQSASGYFRAMLASPETSLLGLRGLFIQARRAGDREAALDLARRAFKQRANTAWAAQAVFELEAASENWGDALRTLDKTLSAKLITRDVARHKRALLLTAQAMTAEEAAMMQHGDARLAACEVALGQAQQAHSLAPEFSPAIAMIVRLCGVCGKVRRGTRLAEDAWSKNPHPDIADAFLALVPGEGALARLGRVRQLVSRNPKHIESDVVLARAAIAARDWQTARQALETHVGAAALLPPTQRLCELMADLEDGEHGDRGAARAWLARALHAPEDDMWVGENYRSPRWSPVNPVTGEFDGLVWRAPVLHLPRAEMAPEAACDIAAPVVAPASTEEKPLTPPATDPNAAPKPVAPLASDALDDEAFAFLTPLPDDPGPEGAEEEDREAERRGSW